MIITVSTVIVCHHTLLQTFFLVKIHLRSTLLATFKDGMQY